MTTFYEIIKEIFYEKTRTILMITAIAFGTFSISFTLAIGEGLRLNFGQTVANAGNKLVNIHAGTTTKNYRGIKTNEPIKFTKKDVRGVASLPNIIDVTVQYEFLPELRYNNQEVYAEFRAVGPEYLKIHNLRVQPKQRFFSSVDMQKRSAVVAIGAKKAKQIFASNENPIGKIIYIDNYPFTIIGIMEQKNQTEYMGKPDDWLCFIPITTYELFKNPQYVDTIVATYKDYLSLKSTKEQIQKIIAINHGADPGDKNIVKFSDIAEAQENYNKFFIRLQMFFGLIGGLTLFLAAIGITNVMYMTVKKSTQQIGVRMALGATKLHIVWRYLIGSLITTLIGGIIGIIMTIGAVYLIRLIPLPSTMVEAIGKPKPVLSLLVFFISIMVLGITGLVAGLLPAMKAAKIDPSEALQYE
jgi:putative ABC transport system permease protein